MKKRRIDADIALNDIRSGLDDRALMAKYRLSAKGLQSLFNKLIEGGLMDVTELDQRMPTFMGTVFVTDILDPAAESEALAQSDSGTRRRIRSPIKLEEVTQDIRSGADDSALMEKYDLSSKGLQSLFEHLIFSGFMTEMELDTRVSTFDSTVDVHGLKGQLEKLLNSAAAPSEDKVVLWECPACGRPQTRVYDECPVCGVIVSKYRAKMERDQRLKTPES